MSLKLLKKSEVIEKTSVSHSSLYGFIREKTFPTPIKIGKRSAWPLSEIDLVCAAWVRGADDSELRELVSKIEAARKSPSQA